MRILQLIAMVRSLLGNLGLDLSDLLALIQKIMSIGFPPEVKDESAFRAWLAKLADVAVEVAAVTPIVLDDAFAKFLKNATTDDAAWATLYSILTMFMAPDGALTATVSEGDLLSASDKLCTQMRGETLGLNPAMILAIIKLIIDIINAWKK